MKTILNEFKCVKYVSDTCFINNNITNHIPNVWGYKLSFRVADRLYEVYYLFVEAIALYSMYKLIAR